MELKISKMTNPFKLKKGEKFTAYDIYSDMDTDCVAREKSVKATSENGGMDDSTIQMVHADINDQVIGYVFYSMDNNRWEFDGGDMNLD